MCRPRSVGGATEQGRHYPTIPTVRRGAALALNPGSERALDCCEAGWYGEREDGEVMEILPLAYDQ